MTKRPKPRTLTIGVVSSDTMRPEDLIPSFLWECDHLRLSRAERQTVRTIARESDVDGYFEGAIQDSDPSEDLDQLFEILSAHCPDYCYFGASEGDGACYGCFPVSELFTDTTQGSYDGQVYRANDTDAMHAGGIPSGYSHCLCVNDHGNATLYRRAGRRWLEVWAVV